MLATFTANKSASWDRNNMMSMFQHRSVDRIRNGLFLRSLCLRRRFSRSQKLLFSADKPTCPSHTRSKMVTSKLVIHSLSRFIAFSTDFGPVLGLAHHSSNTGWPSYITAIPQQVWPVQRYIEFDRHVTIHPRTLPSCGVAQGCPFAPMALACVMACGRHSVNEILHNSYGYSIEETQMANTKIYMDDRTFVDAAYQRCLDSTGLGKNQGDARQTRC